MDTAPFVPYQAYKSKRHSRNLSGQNTSPGPASPSPTRPSTNGSYLSPPSSSPTHTHPPLPNGSSVLSPNGNGVQYGHTRSYSSSTDSSVLIVPRASSPTQNAPLTSGYATYKKSEAAPSLTPPPPPKENPVQAPQPSLAAPAINRISVVSPPIPESNAVASTSTSASPAPPSPSASTTRRTSTFRHVPLRGQSTALPSSPLRPAVAPSRAVSLSSRAFEQTLAPPRELPRSRLSSDVSHARLSAAPLSRETSTGSSSNVRIPSPLGPSPQPPAKDRPLSSLDTNFSPALTPEPHSSASSPSRGATLSPIQTGTQSQGHPPTPPPKSPSPISTHPSRPPSGFHSPSPSTTTLPRSTTSTPTRVSAAPRQSAPYRPGFQPKGVYRPRTDEFLDARREKRDVDRVERTRLERRLEKLITLHFSEHKPANKEKAAETEKRPNTMAIRRASSIFDFNIRDLRNMDAGDLWRGVVTSQTPAPGSKADIRASEQSITPWEEDASVSQCPLCAASFHPITNRKHHCRLCGRIVCALPVKRPQRPVTCSLLFVADPKTGAIEEVGEGVDYGVRKRTSSTVGPAQGKKTGKDITAEEEKFLKGVRICRDCSPVLLRHRYTQEAAQVPTFSKLYDAFINLEKEIEDALPLFQELLMTLNNDDQPTVEASAARKRLLEAFAQYDALAKRIRTLPTPGPGSSQDRVQAAILARGTAFLQKNMFPLQSLPKPKKHPSRTSSTSNSPASTSSPATPAPAPIDPDSEVAHVLQPLLEQEALLETFVEQAAASRKFEDAKTLKTNLREIRGEIEKVLANAEENGGGIGGGASASASGKRQKKGKGK
ncbi:uncharacterized protein STEHIDRAFT_74653 [Stereum hirsutum FP-91666 SS1]|uniref:uncharacterized protein n=1 Tax=Stereum hirsutum (strain FP-91666) TaxID=721885 RepID=UPI000440D3C1|nr:uncharacterized protein STEHIDRAFT_74653 [Stereum hirsutum FP-91666 SS1]EIM90120.1 hypothetical protein STEHIDRAFT_74653 [Stereum hirsutum FP-91666 SS1]